MRLPFAVLSALVGTATQVAARAAYQLHGRGTMDVCANIDGLLEVPVPFAGTIPIGFLEICLCISDIPDLLTTNGVVISAVVVAGRDATIAALTAMINDASDHKSCSFPDHATHECSISEPCAFGCKDGFSPSPISHPTDCVCKAPSTVCNGICGPFKACPSSKPKKRELDAVERRSLCDPGFTACGVYGWQNFNSAEAWECIDTDSDLESCGGCAIGFGRAPALGIDCTAISGVMDVSCVRGSCAVQRCQSGYIVSPDKATCIHANVAAKLIQGDVPAAIYGLEHVPLAKKST